jgi:cyclin H
MAPLTEDDVYRASTQYRLWSHTPEALSSLRAKTNHLAAAAIQNEHHNHGGSAEPLNVEEELALVTHVTRQCLGVADGIKLPTNVKATAAQYLKRFYLTTSVMDIHPKKIFPGCLYLATKAEHHYISLSSFTEKLNACVGPKSKVTSEEVVAPEFRITKGVRFTLTVRHPLRGLRGGLMELLAMAHGTAALLPDLGKTSQQIQKDMMTLPLPAGSSLKTTTTPRDLEARCFEAVDKAKDILATGALLTDVYFLYTPAQIWLAALLAVDEHLASFYLDSKFPIASNPAAYDSTSASTIDDAELAKAKIINLIRECASIMHSTGGAQTSREELIRIDKKLYKCTEKQESGGMNGAVKRNSVSLEGGVVDEKAVKKRKSEREKREREGDVFGGELLGKE